MKVKTDHRLDNSVSLLHKKLFNQITHGKEMEMNDITIDTMDQLMTEIDNDIKDNDCKKDGGKIDNSWDSYEYSAKIQEFISKPVRSLK